MKYFYIEIHYKKSHTHNFNFSCWQKWWMRRVYPWDWSIRLCRGFYRCQRIWPSDWSTFPTSTSLPTTTQSRRTRRPLSNRTSMTWTTKALNLQPITGQTVWIPQCAKFRKIVPNPCILLFACLRAKIFLFWKKRWRIVRRQTQVDITCNRKIKLYSKGHAA